MKRFLTAILILLPGLHASAIVDPDFNSPVLRAVGGEAGPSHLDAWYANFPGDPRSWYQEGDRAFAVDD